MNKIKVTLVSLFLLFGCSSGENGIQAPPPPTPNPPPQSGVGVSTSEPTYSRFVLCNERGILEERVFNKNESQYIYFIHEGFPKPTHIKYSWRSVVGDEISRNSFLWARDVEGLYSVHLFSTVVLPSGEELTQLHEPIKVYPHEIFLDIKEILDKDYLLVVAYNHTEAKRIGISPESYNPLQDSWHSSLAIEPEFNGEYLLEETPYREYLSSSEFVDGEFDENEIFSSIEVVEEVSQDEGYGQYLTYEWYVDGVLIPDETTYRYPLSRWPEGTSLKVIVVSEEFVPVEKEIQANRSLSDS